MTPIATRAGQLCVAAAALIVSSEVLRLLVGLLGGPDSVTTPAHTLTYAVALAGMYAGTSPSYPTPSVTTSGTTLPATLLDRPKSTVPGRRVGPRPR